MIAVPTVSINSRGQLVDDEIECGYHGCGSTHWALVPAFGTEADPDGVRRAELSGVERSGLVYVLDG